MQLLPTMVYKFRYRFLRRLRNRLRPIFRFKEIWNWEAETCDRCGSCFHLAYNLRDDVWIKINGSETGCLCFNCVVAVALLRGIALSREDIEFMFLFSDEGQTPELSDHLLPWDENWTIHNHCHKRK